MAELTFKQKRALTAAGGGYRHRRRLDPEMPTADELVVALWEHLVEGRPLAEAAAALQARRLRVKARHPKPDRAGR